MLPPSSDESLGQSPWSCFLFLCFFFPITAIFPVGFDSVTRIGPQIPTKYQQPDMVTRLCGQLINKLTKYWQQGMSVKKCSPKNTNIIIILHNQLNDFHYFKYTWHQTKIGGWTQKLNMCSLSWQSHLTVTALTGLQEKQYNKRESKYQNSSAILQYLSLLWEKYSSCEGFYYPSIHTWNYKHK